MVRKEHIIDFTRINPIYPTHEPIRLSCPVLDSYHLRPRTFFSFPIGVSETSIPSTFTSWFDDFPHGLRATCSHCCAVAETQLPRHEFLSCEARGTCHDSRWWRGVWLIQRAKSMWLRFVVLELPGHSNWSTRGILSSTKPDVNLRGHLWRVSCSE